MAGPQTSSDRGKGCGCLLVLALALVASNLGTLGALSYFVVKDVRSPTGGDGGGEQHWGVEPSRVTYAPNLSTSHLKRYITSHNGTAMDGAATISFATLVMPTSGTVDRRSLQADGSEAAQAAHSHELHVELLRRTALGHFLTKRSMPAQSGRRLSEGAVRLRIRDTASKAESVIIPMEFDAQQLVYSDSDDVLRSNFSGVNPRIIFFAHKRHARDPHARAVHTFVSLPDDHRVMPTFHAGVGEREWREHVMPFYHAYWRAWVHSTVAAYPLQDEIVAHLTEQAKAVGRTLGGTRHGTSAGARSRQLSSSGAEGVQKDAKDFAIESVAEKVGAHALDGKGGSVVGTVAGVILDRHEWAAHPAQEAKEEVKEDIGATVVSKATKEVGKDAGAALGAAVGGPVGAVVGEEVGGVIGAKVGEFAGAEAVGHAKAIHQAAHQAKQTVQQHAKQAVQQHLG